MRSGKYIVGAVSLLCVIILAWIVFKPKPESMPSVNAPSRTVADTVPPEVAGFTDLVYHERIIIGFSRFDTMNSVQLRKIKRFIEKPPDGFGWFSQDFASSNEKAASQFRQIDFSGDGVPDLVLSVPAYGEEYTTFLWVKVDSMYKFCAALWGSPDAILRDSTSGAYSMVLVSGYCCAGTIGDYTLFVPSIAAGKLSYSPKEIIRECDDTQLPKYRLASRPFALPDSLNIIRLWPDEYNDLDTDRTFGDDTAWGNILAKIPRGSRGFALAQQTDTFGIRWTFVVLQPSVQPLYTMMYQSAASSEYGIGSQMAGWIEEDSLRFLK